MDKVDFKKMIDSYSAPRGRFQIIEVSELHYLAIDGHGDPNASPAYAAALAALYPVAYKLKFASKRELGRDYVMPPLEGLWWADDLDVFTVARDKAQWKWTMMLMVPEWIGHTMVEAAIARVGDKDAPVRLGEVGFRSLSEGRCVQTLHLGSFDAEGPVLERMHREFIPDNGLRPVGKHHEIYFSDFRRTPAARLRTILRQPVSWSD